MLQRNIMLIDDDPDELEIFTAALDKVDCTITCTYANCASAALNILNEKVPDYIFVDMNMPAVNGIECIDKIKSIKKVSHIPIFLYSTSIDSITQAKAINAGAAKCIKKPGDFIALKSILNEICYTN